jgi:hypothetical protein
MSGPVSAVTVREMRAKRKRRTEEKTETTVRALASV